MASNSNISLYDILADRQRDLRALQKKLLDEQKKDRRPGSDILYTTPLNSIGQLLEYFNEFTSKPALNERSRSVLERYQKVKTALNKSLSPADIKTLSSFDLYKPGDLSKFLTAYEEIFNRITAGPVAQEAPRAPAEPPKPISVDQFFANVDSQGIIKKDDQNAILRLIRTYAKGKDIGNLYQDLFVMGQYFRSDNLSVQQLNEFRNKNPAYESFIKEVLERYEDLEMRKRMQEVPALGAAAAPTPAKAAAAPAVAAAAPAKAVAPPSGKPPLTPELAERAINLIAALEKAARPYWLKADRKQINIPWFIPNFARPGYTKEQILDRVESHGPFDTRISEKTKDDFLDLKGIFNKHPEFVAAMINTPAKERRSQQTEFLPRIVTESVKATSPQPAPAKAPVAPAKAAAPQPMQPKAAAPAPAEPVRRAPVQPAARTPYYPEINAIATKHIPGVAFQVAQKGNIKGLQEVFEGFRITVVEECRRLINDFMKSAKNSSSDAELKYGYELLKKAQEVLGTGEILQQQYEKFIEVPKNPAVDLNLRLIALKDASQNLEKLIQSLQQKEIEKMAAKGKPPLSVAGTPPKYIEPEAPPPAPAKAATPPPRPARPKAATLAKVAQAPPQPAPAKAPVAPAAATPPTVAPPSQPAQPKPAAPPLPTSKPPALPSTPPPPLPPISSIPKPKQPAATTTPQQPAAAATPIPTKPPAPTRAAPKRPDAPQTQLAAELRAAMDQLHANASATPKEQRKGQTPGQTPPKPTPAPVIPSGKPKPPPMPKGPPPKLPGATPANPVEPPAPDKGKVGPSRR